MPIVKQSKKLDGSNSIYRASRKVAARQLKNMKGIALDTGETDVQSPIPTARNSPDTEGLVPKLLQNVSDVNGLLTSLKMVGASDVNPPRRGAGRKSLCGGALTPSQIRSIERQIADMNDKVIRARQEIEQFQKEIRDNEKINATSSAEKASKRNAIYNLQRKVTTRENNIKKFEAEIDQLRDRLLRKDEDEGGKEGVPSPPPPPPPREDDEEDTQESLNDAINEIMPLLDAIWDSYIERGEDVPKHWRNRLISRAEDADTYSQLLGRPRISIKKYKLYRGDELVWPLNRGEYEGPVPSQTPIPVEEVEEDEADELPAGDDGYGDYEADEIAARFDFSKVNKSTLLVILNQLKSVVKAGEIILKKIVHKNVMASESDLNSLTDELADMIYAKRFLYTHIDQIMRKSRDLGEYLRTILSGVLSKYIEALKIYVKRYAQLNIQQINSIQENVEGNEIQEPEAEVVVGAGRGYHPVVLSDAVRRISKFDRKYIL